MSSNANYLTKSDAARQAAHVKAYWGKMGWKVETWVEPIGGALGWAARSDLVHGLPKRYHGSLAPTSPRRGISG